MPCVRRNRLGLEPTLLAAAAILLQGCAVSHYHLHGSIPARSGTVPDCAYKYSLTRDGLSDPAGSTAKGYVKKDTWRKYPYDLEVTESVFAEAGCSAVFVMPDQSPDFEILISERVFPEAFQDWLTGLSLGLIPSWKTADGLITYTFRNHATGKERSYSADGFSAVHLFFAPLTLLQFGLDMGGVYRQEAATYRRALAYFLRDPP